MKLGKTDLITKMGLANKAFSHMVPARGSSDVLLWANITLHFEMSSAVTGLKEV